MRKRVLTLIALALVGGLTVDALAARPPGPRGNGAPSADKSHWPSHRPGGRFSGEGRGPFGHRRGPPIFQELTDEEIEQVLAFTRETFPERYEQLKGLRESNPQMFRYACRRLRFEIGQLQHLKKTDKEAYRAAIEERRLKERAADLARRIRQAESEDERRKLTEELQDVASRVFDAEMKARKAQLHELDKRIEAFRRHLEERANQRDAIVKHTVEEYLEGRRDEGWKRPPFSPPPPPDPEP